MRESDSGVELRESEGVSGHSKHSLHCCCCSASFSAFCCFSLLFVVVLVWVGENGTFDERLRKM